MPPFSAPNLADLVKIIARAQAEVIIVGRIAMTLRGGSYVTYDFDVCYRREPGTIARLCRALAPHRPHLCCALSDIQTAPLTEAMSLDTDLGRIDLLGVLAGIGDYEQVLQLSQTMTVDDVVVQVLSLDGLIATKEAILREKDLLHLPMLRALKALKDEEEL